MYLADPQVGAAVTSAALSLMAAYRLPSAAPVACGHGGLVHGPGGITAREAGAR
jgi:hypothetical protein